VHQVLCRQIEKKKGSERPCVWRKEGEKTKKSETSLCDSFCLATFLRCDPENERFCSITEKWKKMENESFKRCIITRKKNLKARNDQSSF